MNHLIRFIVLLSPLFLNAQIQLDIQGSSNSNDTVAKIQVNYAGPSNAVGLHVYSAPAPETGIGGDFYGGAAGLQATSIDGIGVVGISTSNYGVGGFSTHYFGVVGESFDSTGVAGGSIHGYGIRGGSINSVGVYANSENITQFDVLAETTDGSKGFGVTSSRRWKTNIRNIPNPLDKLNHLRGVYVNWSPAYGGGHDLGFIAEEVGAVLPEIVSFEENGIDAIGVDYGRMTPLLVEAVKALQELYEHQGIQLKKLSDKLEYLQFKVETLQVK